MPAAKYRSNQPVQLEEITNDQHQKWLQMGLTLLIKDPRNVKWLKGLLKLAKINQKDLGDEFIEFLRKKYVDTLTNQRDYWEMQQHRLAKAFADETKQLFSQFINIVFEKMLNNDQWLDGKNPNLEE